MTDWRAVAREHMPFWDEGDEAGAAEAVTVLDRLGVRHSPVAEWDRGPYQPLGAYGIKYPVLVACLPDLPEGDLPPGEWIAVRHHSMGFTCWHDDLVVKVLEPREREGMRRLSDHYVGTNLEDPTIDDLVDYRERLGRLLGVSSPPREKWVREAWYPVDAADASVMTGDEVPEGARLVILGENGNVPPDEQEVPSDEPGTEADPGVAREPSDAAGEWKPPAPQPSVLGLLALVLATYAGGPAPEDERRWQAVRHADQEWLVTVLSPREEGVWRLAEEYAGRVPEHEEGPTLDELIAYRERLRELTGADLTRPSWHLGPSTLPIDVEQVPHLTGERIDLPRGDTWHLLLML